MAGQGRNPPDRPHCKHELERAIARDPEFQRGITIPIVLEKCSISASIQIPDPLRLHLKNEKTTEDWDRLLAACGIDLGTSAPQWLVARDRVRRMLLNNESVNLHVIGENVQWRPMLDDLRREIRLSKLGEVNLGNPQVFPQHEFLAAIAKAAGAPSLIPPGEDGLAEFGRILENRPVSRIGILRFENTEALSGYKTDFFIALRNWIMESRRLVLLVQSHKPFSLLVPKDHILWKITIDVVELRGRS